MPCEIQPKAKFRLDSISHLFSPISLHHTQLRLFSYIIFSYWIINNISIHVCLSASRSIRKNYIVSNAQQGYGNARWDEKLRLNDTL